MREDETKALLDAAEVLLYLGLPPWNEAGVDLALIGPTPHPGLQTILAGWKHPAFQALLR